MRKSLLFHHLVLNMILCFFVTSLFSCTDHIIQEQIIPDNNQENLWAFPLFINVGLSNDKTRINYEIMEQTV